MQVAPSASTYAPAPGDLASPPAPGSAFNSYTDQSQDNAGAFTDSGPGGYAQPDPQSLQNPQADPALASTSLFAPTDPTSGTLAQMVQAQTKPLLITAENAAGLGIDFAHTKPLTVTPENAAGLNLPPQTGSAAPASATAPNASPTEIAALELLLAEPANQEMVAQFGPPLRPLNTDTDVGQGILARFGPDLGARLTQLQEAHNAVRDEFLQALDHAQQNPGPDVAGSELIAQRYNWRDHDVTEKTLHSVTHPPSPTQEGDLKAIDEQVKLGLMGRADHIWRLSDPAEFAKAYAAGDSPAQKAFAQLHGKEPLQFHDEVRTGETDAGPQITPAYYSVGDIQLVRGGPTVTENGNPGPWAASTWQSPQLTPEQNRDLINNEYLWFDPVNGWSTDLANNIKQSTSFLDKALPMVFAGVMTFATAGAFGITAASASTSLGQSMALGAISSATMQLTTGGKIDLGDLLRSALTAGVTFGVTNLTGLGTALQSTDLATRSLGHLGKAGLQGVLQEATGGKFKDGLTNSLLASVAGEVGKSLDSHIAALSENGELSVQEASMLKLLSRAASSAVKVVGSNDPAAGFASDFLGEVLGEELRGAQAKEPSQSQDPSQTANGAGDKPSSDWVRNLGPSEVDAQGLGLRPGPAGQGLQISGDALSNWSNEIDGGIALNGSMAPGAQAITEAVVGQGQGPLAALAAAGLDRQQQIAAYGQLVASGQVQLNAQGIPIVQPGQVLQFDLSDMSAAQLGGRAIAQESAGLAQREQQLAAQQAAETAHTTQEKQERWDQMRMAWGGRTGTQGPVWHVGGSAQAQSMAAQTSNTISQAEAQSIAVALAGGFAPLDSSLSPDIASGVGSPLVLSSAGATAGVGVSLGKAALGTARMLSDNVNVALDIATGGVFHNTPLMQQSWANNAAVGSAMINAVSSPRETATDVMESIGNRFSAATAITDNDFQRSYSLGELATDVAQAGVGGVFGVRSLARLGASEMRLAGLQDYAIRPGALPEGLARNSQAGGIGLPELVAVDATGVPLAGVGKVANSGRDALIAESRAQSAYLESKYGGLSSAERMGRLDKLAEANAYRHLQELESSIPGAHFLEKHGAQTTLQSQLERVQFGKNPTTGVIETYANGNPKIPSSATRFLSNRDQLNAIDRAQNIYRMTGDPLLAEQPISFNYLIGEGYKKTSLAYGQSYHGQVWFRNGQVNTTFPIWGK